MLAGELSDFERRFAEEYAVDLNRVRAVRAAGYSGTDPHNAAYRHLAKPQVQEYLAYLKAEQKERTGVNADYVLKLIVEAAERGRGLIEKIEDEDGEERVIVHERDNKAVLKAAELLGKHLKMFTDMTETKHTFTQMGSVTVGNAQNGDTKELTFDVGGEPNAIKPD